ncbi:hypothetical protein UG55_101869 [Frankia sp. EI5c]|uniref:hypothetical protein n=1 Tax=Frankia sp. EI5c TaxID=683316 RepID=UPI0007C2DF9A|nr:hypothetical protein [Frankia sp. EI5c]OAA26059.1 hypothetical protein UG55_101869 [Frankia sp. EI5c]
MPDAHERVVALARSQDDMVTRREARRLGLSDAAIAARRRAGGWRSPIRGTLLVPPVRDRVRACARAALAVAGGVVCLVTAARLHGVPGLPPRAAGEPVDVAFTDPALAGRRRAGCRRHLMPVALPVAPATPAGLTDLGGITVTSLHRTLRDIVLRLDRCLAAAMMRAVLRLGWLGGRGLPGGPVSPGCSRGGYPARPTHAFLRLKEDVLRRNDAGEGPGGGPEFWRLVEAGPPGDPVAAARRQGVPTLTAGSPGRPRPASSPRLSAGAPADVEGVRLGE